MKIQYINIEYDENNGNKIQQKIDKVFTLALVDAPQGPLKACWGINIGISIPHDNQNDADVFSNSIFGNTKFKDDGFIKIFLNGDGGERVPIMIHTANLYEPRFGTSCLFGYMTPDWLAGDERPKI